MSVFISYKHLDRDLAMQINNRLKLEDIDTYLDVLDPESQSTENITTVITKNIALCTHLIAIVSKETATSWWVPFEIGEATISVKRIASYRSGYSSLPEYLEMWPKMDTMQHLEFFIAEYKSERQRATYNRNIFESVGSVGTKSASDFHNNLKTKIRRGY
jgi:hypothetical protein